jgi:hypothetical protein
LEGIEFRRELPIAVGDINVASELAAWRPQVARPAPTTPSNEQPVAPGEQPIPSGEQPVSPDEAPPPAETVATPPAPAAAPVADALAQEIERLKVSPEFVPGKYTLELTDAGGLTSKRPLSFVVNLKDDREPKLNPARLVGVSGMVVKQATVPYTARVEDDFSVVDVQLAYRWRSEDTSVAGGSGRLPVPTVAGKLPVKTVVVEDALELSALNLEPGASLTLFLEGTDNDNVSGPNVGKSADFLLRVVTEEQLRTDILRREKEQRQDLERLLKNQEDLLTDVTALAAGVAGAPDFSEEQKLTLMGLQKRQNLISTNASGVANIFAAITVEIVNNKLEDENGVLLKRLRERVIAPLRRAAGSEVQAALNQLDKARRLAASPAERDGALMGAQEAQKVIIATMQDVLANMAKAEGFQEAINLLYELERAQKDVFDRTIQEEKERIRRQLENDEKPTLPESSPKPE